MQLLTLVALASAVIHAAAFDDGLTVRPPRLFPASEPACWDVASALPYSRAPVGPLPADAPAGASAFAQASAALTWLAAPGGAAVAPRATSSPYAVWEVARLSDGAREELVDRFADVLPLARPDVSVISPALVTAPGGGFSAFLRLTWRQGQWSFGSHVMQQALGAELAPHSASPLAAVPLPAAMDVAAGGAEDPRAIVRPSDGAVLVAFNAQLSKEGGRAM